MVAWDNSSASTDLDGGRARLDEWADRGWEKQPFNVSALGGISASAELIGLLSFNLYAIPEPSRSHS